MTEKISDMLLSKNERKILRKELRKVAHDEWKKEEKEYLEWYRKTKPKIEYIREKMEHPHPDTKINKRERKLFFDFYLITGEEWCKPRTLADAIKIGWDKGADYNIETSLKAVTTFFLEQFGISMDYSRTSLKRIDDFVSGGLAARMEKEGAKRSKEDLYYDYCGIGFYFGEVLVRELHGKWKYPSESWRVFIAYLPRSQYRIQLIINRIFVSVKNRNIPVVRIAKMSCNGSNQIGSLTEVYDKIVAGRHWKTHN